MVPDARGALVTDCTPLTNAEPYGDFLTHPRGHYEVWEEWQRLGPTGLVQRGLPEAIAWYEYEDCPRGRVVHHRQDQRFILYADRRLQTPAHIAAIKTCFALTDQPTTVQSDAHYSTGPRRF
jgi:hypothetical protein